MLIIAIILLIAIVMIGFVTRDMIGSKVFLINAGIIALYNLVGWIYLSSLAGGESEGLSIWLVIITIVHTVLSIICYAIYGMVYAANKQH